MADFSKVRKSLKRLEEQYENLRNLDPSWPGYVIDGMTESVIKRFEICYDCTWKALKRYMTETLGVPEVPNSPKPVFRLANENRILGGDIGSWLDYAQRRVDTVHDYSFEKAQTCLEIVGDFIDDAIEVYETIADEGWG